MAQLFTVPVPCCMEVEASQCVCSPEERAIRAYAGNSCPIPLTPLQREWAIAEADWAAEGALTREELADMSDQELAVSLLHAWADYARSQGVI